MTDADPPRHWLDLTEDERTAAAAALGLPAFRARQLTRQLLTRLEDDPSGWTDIPAGAREPLSAFVPRLLDQVRDLRADGGTTVKTLWRLAGDVLVESVIMRYQSRATVCVSAQAGCGMGCPFCATGQGGLKRNLSTGEIVAQVVDAARRLRDGAVAGGPGRLSNVVFMGMGEPLANYGAVVRAIRTITAPDGLGLSARGLTVSTVGLAPRVEQLAAEGLPVTLAISLHAPDDELRDELCPINKRWGVAAVLDAARAYFDATGRRVSVEYALIRDVNDQRWRAELLARVLTRRGRGWAHVNVIPLNPTPGSRWTASRRRDEAAFVGELERAGVPVTVRDTRGRDIDGACGQLAGSHGESHP